MVHIMPHCTVLPRTLPARVHNLPVRADAHHSRAAHDTTYTAVPPQQVNAPSTQRTTHARLPPLPNNRAYFSQGFAS